MTSHWLYPVNPASDYVLVNDVDGSTEAVSPESVNRSALDGTSSTSWILNSGFKTMKPGDLLWIYFALPLQKVTGVAQVQEIYKAPDGWRADLLWLPEWCRQLFDHPIPAHELDSRPQSVRRASEQGAKYLDRWISKAGVYAPTANPTDEPISAEDARLKALATINVRKGQTAFREQLIRAFEGTCAVTGCSERAVLDAAHIQPYRGEQTNVPGNGLLLRTDIHTLFDLHLIAVDPDMKLLVSRTVTDRAYRRLAGSDVRMPADSRWHPRKGLLAEHRRAMR